MLASALLLVVLAAAAPPAVPLAEYAARRAELRARLGSDGVAVVFAAAVGRDGERFRQDPGFYYLTGRREADAILVLAPATADESETLYLPARDRRREHWIGERLGAGGADLEGEPDPARRQAQEVTGIGRVRELEAFNRDLLRQLRDGRTLWLATPATSLDEPLGRELRLVRDLRDRLPSWLTVADLAEPIAELRLRKSEAEIGQIRRAIAVTIEAQLDVARRLRPGLWEYEVKGLVEYAFRRNGSAGPAFGCIVGAGANTTVLHYADDGSRLEPGELLLVDIGAEWAGYAADITRTWPVSGTFSPRQREIYDVVLRAEEAAIAAVKPGARLRGDVHRAAREVIEAAGFGPQFTHATSHHVGLDVHDPGPRDGELAAGMVIAVEPGIYLVDEGIGVRIEDMLLVTRTGCEVLTRELPRAIAAIEGLVRDGGGRTSSAGGRLNVESDKLESDKLEGP